jgi:hypothetical protein
MRVIFFSQLVGLVALALTGCASSPDSPSSVLEPVEEPTAAAEVAAEPVVAAPTPASPLLEQLRQLGYQGLGMEFEDPKVLALLTKVFASPEAQNLDLKLVYTGMRMQYDASQKSITIGGTRDIKVILAFLKKNVPKRTHKPASEPASKPMPLLPE